MLVCTYMYGQMYACRTHACMCVHVYWYAHKCVDACLGFYSRRKKGEPCTDVSGTLVALEDLEPRPKPALRRFLLLAAVNRRALGFYGSEFLRKGLGLWFHQGFKASHKLWMSCLRERGSHQLHRRFAGLSFNPLGFYGSQRR